MVKNLNTGFTLHNCLLGSVKLTKNADLDKYKFSNVIILIKSVASKIKNNYYQNIFLEKVHIKINPIQNIFKWMFVYFKCYISIELTFLKELMLIKQVHLKCVIFVTTGIF